MKHEKVPQTLPAKYRYKTLPQTEKRTSKKFFNLCLGKTKHEKVSQPIPGGNETLKCSATFAWEKRNMKRFLNLCLEEKNIKKFLNPCLGKSKPKNLPQTLARRL